MHQQNGSLDNMAWQQKEAPALATEAWQQPKHNLKDKRSL